MKISEVELIEVLSEVVTPNDKIRCFVEHKEDRVVLNIYVNGKGGITYNVVKKIDNNLYGVNLFLNSDSEEGMTLDTLLALKNEILDKLFKYLEIRVDDKELLIGRMNQILCDIEDLIRRTPKELQYISYNGYDCDYSLEIARINIKRLLEMYEYKFNGRKA